MHLFYPKENIMSVTATSSSTPIATRSAYAPGPNHIKIDWEKFTDYTGYKLDKVLALSYGEDEFLDVKKVEDLMQLGDIKTMPFEGDFAISFTFKTAVQYVVDLLNQYGAESPKFMGFEIPPQPRQTIHGEIYHTLRKCPTPHLHLLTPPPKSERCGWAADRSDLMFMLGGIIHMLHEQGYIEAYGLAPHHSHFWVKF
jgi:hypothetical protein